MSTKKQLLQILSENENRFLSGSELAARLAVSRTAVWKAISQLRKEGYRISSVQNKGHCLTSGSDVLTAAGVENYLKTQGISVRYYREISSTNTVLKTMAAEGAREGLVLIAEEQTGGKGRMGRRFYSPPGSGLYMSILLRPGTEASRSTGITACAAVAVALAIEELSGRPANIKWVNDIYMDKRKVCGILTEASVDCESGLLNYAVVGIGINTLVPAGDFPQELQTIAGSAFSAETVVPHLRCRLAAAVIDNLMTFYQNPDSGNCFEEYKKRSFLLGKPVRIHRPDQAAIPATAIDLDREYALIVRFEDGSEQRINSGEVSVRLADL